MDKILGAYFKKGIRFNYRGKDLKYKVSQSLFSSHDIDIGTKRLLRTFMLKDFQNYNKVLDLGCGYGPLGIALKSANKSSRVHMIDRDALALAFSRINSELNQVDDIKIYGGLGYDDVNDRDFDLIVSNLPAKVGEEVLSDMLTGGRYHLVSKGRMSIVVIDAIYDYVAKILSVPSINILYHKSWPGHHVFHYEYLENEKLSRPRKSAWEKGKYDRKVVNISFPEPLKFSIQTTYNLPEFDTLSYDTELLLRNLNLIEDNNTEKVLFFNPSQGYLPVALSKLREISKIKLIDRNLQSLRISKKNLVRNGYSRKKISISHQVGLGQSDKKAYDCVVGTVDDKENSKVLKIIVQQTVSLIDKWGVALFASSSGVITDMERYVRKINTLRVLKRGRSKGRSFLAIQSR